ncbi:hypothetical protein EX30DRAFT_352206 [Ascodesmis nigricans]|uniref:Uncharacterized protein n=1 Tax=Ascodesmis nigricans TaxID=341454 RepID=A0A4S2MR01_9PEZI|nr:hypothetical protein EX30DRAFT_352206 [Ascodesmis nigricans]
MGDSYRPDQRGRDLPRVPRADDIPRGQRNHYDHPVRQSRWDQRPGPERYDAPSRGSRGETLTLFTPGVASHPPSRFPEPPAQQFARRITFPSSSSSSSSSHTPAPPRPPRPPGNHIYPSPQFEQFSNPPRQQQPFPTPHSTPVASANWGGHVRRPFSVAPPLPPQPTFPPSRQEERGRYESAASIDLSQLPPLRHNSDAYRPPPRNGDVCNNAHPTHSRPPVQAAPRFQGDYYRPNADSPPPVRRMEMVVGRQTPPRVFGRSDAKGRDGSGGFGNQPGRTLQQMLHDTPRNPPTPPKPGGSRCFEHHYPPPPSQPIENNHPTNTLQLPISNTPTQPPKPPRREPPFTAPRAPAPTTSMSDTPSSARIQTALALLAQQEARLARKKARRAEKLAEEQKRWETRLAGYLEALANGKTITELALSMRDERRLKGVLKAQRKGEKPSKRGGKNDPRAKPTTTMNTGIRRATTDTASTTPAMTAMETMDLHSLAAQLAQEDAQPHPTNTEEAAKRRMEREKRYRAVFEADREERRRKGFPVKPYRTLEEVRREIGDRRERERRVVPVPVPGAEMENGRSGDTYPAATRRPVDLIAGIGQQPAGPESKKRKHPDVSKNAKSPKQKTTPKSKPTAATRSTTPTTQKKKHHLTGNSARPPPDLVPSATDRALISAHELTLHPLGLQRAAFTKSPLHPSYTYVPRGNAFITKRIKAYTLALRKPFYVVRDGRTSYLGYQCPTAVYRRALKHEEESRSERQMKRMKDPGVRVKVRQAEAVLEGMFLSMPPVVKAGVVSRLFDEPSRATGDSLPEQLRLAAKAHLESGYDLDAEIQKIMDTIPTLRGQGSAKKVKEREEKARKQAELARDRYCREMWKEWGAEQGTDHNTTLRFARVETFLRIARERGKGVEDDGDGGGGDGEHDDEEEGSCDDDHDADDDDIPLSDLESATDADGVTAAGVMDLSSDSSTSSSAESDSDADPADSDADLLLSSSSDSAPAYITEHPPPRIVLSVSSSDYSSSSSSSSDDDDGLGGDDDLRAAARAVTPHRAALASLEQRRREMKRGRKVKREPVDNDGRHEEREIGGLGDGGDMGGGGDGGDGGEGGDVDVDMDAGSGVEVDAADIDLDRNMRVDEDVDLRDSDLDPALIPYPSTSPVPEVDIDIDMDEEKPVLDRLRNDDHAMQVSRVQTRGRYREKQQHHQEDEEEDDEQIKLEVKEETPWVPRIYISD